MRFWKRRKRRRRADFELPAASSGMGYPADMKPGPLPTEIAQRVRHLNAGMRRAAGLRAEEALERAEAERLRDAAERSLGIVEVNDGYGNPLFYKHRHGWIIRQKKDGRWSAGRNQYEEVARFEHFDRLLAAREWCDEHIDWPTEDPAPPPQTPAECDPHKLSKMLWPFADHLATELPSPEGYYLAWAGRIREAALLLSTCRCRPQPQPESGSGEEGAERSIVLNRHRFKVPGRVMSGADLYALPMPPLNPDEHDLFQETPGRGPDTWINPRQLVDFDQGDVFFSAPRHINASSGGATPTQPLQGSQVERWAAFADGSHEPRPDGEWVRYNDHRADLEKAVHDVGHWARQAGVLLAQIQRVEEETKDALNEAQLRSEQLDAEAKERSRAEARIQEAAEKVEAWASECRDREHKAGPYRAVLSAYESVLDLLRSQSSTEVEEEPFYFTCRDWDKLSPESKRAVEEVVRAAAGKLASPLTAEEREAYNATRQSVIDARSAAHKEGENR